MRFSLLSVPKGKAGGATFLKALKNVLKNDSRYTSNWENADVILLNSHHWLKELFKLIFLRLKGKKFIIRIDGPLQVYRRNFFSIFEDKIIYSISKNLCSGIIYQSYWSSERNKNIDKKLKNIPDRVIYNGCVKDTANKKIKKYDYCLFVSNSNNPLKGINLFKELAYKSKFSKNLNKLKFFVIGNFVECNDDLNYVNLGVLSKKKLAKWMNKSKYYIHASKYEACSNALLEAIKFNMIPFISATSSNIELVKDARLQFSSLDELIFKLETLMQEKTFKPIGLLNTDINLVSKNYLEFFDEIFRNEKIEYKFTILNFINILYTYFQYLVAKIIFMFLQKIKKLF
tara:strand:- start:1065 stop:2096 length:1032 start_codon:yes stop_codon:yes gene_type:complete